MKQKIYIEHEKDRYSIVKNNIFHKFFFAFLDYWNKLRLRRLVVNHKKTFS